METSKHLALPSDPRGHTEGQPCDAVPHCGPSRVEPSRPNLVPIPIVPQTTQLPCEGRGCRFLCSDMKKSPRYAARRKNSQAAGQNFGLFPFLLAQKKAPPKMIIGIAPTPTSRERAHGISDFLVTYFCIVDFFKPLLSSEKPKNSQHLQNQQSRCKAWGCSAPGQPPLLPLPAHLPPVLLTGQ